MFERIRSVRNIFLIVPGRGILSPLGRVAKFVLTASHHYYYYAERHIIQIDGTLGTCWSATRVGTVGTAVIAGIMLLLSPAGI